MRLIDADVFKQQIAGMAIVAGYSPQKANRLCKLIDEQPTAYDIDKVVRQINLESVGSSIQESLGLLKALNIVKASGKYV